MKKWLAVFLTVLLVCVITAVLAEEDTSEWIHGWDWEHPEGKEDVLRLKNYFGDTTTEFEIPAKARLFGHDVKVELDLNCNDFGEKATSIVIDGAKIIFNDEPGLFSYPNLKKLQLKNVTCENLTNMEHFLGGDENLTDLDISCLDTSSVTTMKGMFMNCFLLENIDVSWMKTGNVTDMTGMFQSCYTLKTLDLSKFDTSNVAYFYQMFDSCYELAGVNLSGFKTPAAKSFAEMFIRCTRLNNLNLSGFNTASAQWVDGMFIDCESLTALDLSSFDLRNAEQAQNMFAGCNKLDKITTGTGFRFITYNEETNRFPDVYGGPEWISSKENKSFTIDEIMQNRGGIADTYTRGNPYTLTGVPKNVKATKDGNGVKISWKAVSGADYYNIYRANNVKKQNYTLFEQVGGKTKKFTDTALKAGNEYAYIVVAVNDFYGSQLESTGGPSAPVYWMKLGEVKSLKGTNPSAKTMKLTWKKVTGATGYDVYYTTDKKAPSAATKATKTSNKNELTVKKLKKSKTYYIYVRPFVKLADKSVAYGEWTKAVMVEIKK